jgi:hypothetical protein
MNIHGYSVLSEPSEIAPTVEAGTGKILSDGFDTIVKSRDGKVIRGPFSTVRAAIQCAHDWNAEDEAAAKGKLKAVEEAAPVVVIPATDEPISIGMMVDTTEEDTIETK